MKRNEGTLDRVLRAVAAAGALIVAAIVGFGTIAGIVLVVVAVILAVTAIAGFCPLYRLFGLSTYRPSSSSTPAGDQVGVH
jgi:hypothetical protein